MTPSDNNTVLSSEAGVNWRISLEMFEGFFIRTKDAFGKYVNFKSIETMISRHLEGKAKSSTAFEIATIYHDCDNLTVQIRFINDNEWVV